MLKAVILIGGPQKGTRFRPLSLDIPKPLFPVAGYPMIHHHIEAISQLQGMKEIIIIGSYQANDAISRFVQNAQQEYKIMIRYLQEYTALGTAGGLYHFRDQIMSGSPEMFFVINGDVCGEFPLSEMLQFHKHRANQDTCTILGTEATRQQSLNYGCMVEDKNTHEILHYVEKPETFVSSVINCGVYLFTPSVFNHIAVGFKKHQESLSFDYDSDTNNHEVIRLEQDIFTPLAGIGQLFVFQTQQFWSQIKTTSAAVYANRHYLAIYHHTHPERLAASGPQHPTIIGDVFIHPSATVHPTAMLGPNVSIGRNASVGAGARVRESIVLQGATLKDHCCIMHSIIGWDSVIGEWSRIEGTPNDPNPNKPFAKLEVVDLFNKDGRLNPSVTVIGSNVQTSGEIIVLNSIVLPHKTLNHSFKNQIIL